MPQIVYINPPRYVILFTSYYCILKWTQTIVVVCLLIFGVSLRNFITLITIYLLFPNFIMIILNVFILVGLVYVDTGKLFLAQIESLNVGFNVIFLLLIYLEVMPGEEKKYRSGSNMPDSYDKYLDEDWILFYCTSMFCAIQFCVMVVRILVYFAAKERMGKRAYLFLLIRSVIQMFNSMRNGTEIDEENPENVELNTLNIHVNAFNNIEAGDPNRNEMKAGDPNRNKVKADDSNWKKREKGGSNWKKIENGDQNEMKASDPNRKKLKANDSNWKKNNADDPNGKKMEANGSKWKQMKPDDPNWQKMENVGRNWKKIKNFGPNRNEMKTGDPNRNEMKDGNPNRKKMKANDPNREKIESSDPNWEKIENHGPNREKIESSDPNRKKMENDGPNREKLESSDPNRKKMEAVNPNRKITYM